MRTLTSKCKGCKVPNNEGLKLAAVLIEHKINVTKDDVDNAWKQKNYELVRVLLCFAYYT